jgi:predicted naringenin-chalcone synthase
MSASILSLGTAVPPYTYSQEKIADCLIDMLAIAPDKQDYLRKIYQNSGIQKRHCVMEDFNKERDQWSFWGSQYPQVIPGMSQRNAFYKKKAPELALEAARKALNLWGGALQDITHVISVSCTGVIAPGLEYYLMQGLQLSNSVNRLGINFMGCFGAFKGLSVARAFANENPKHRILLVCTELCSLHLQADQDHDTIVANSLFADGAAAVVVGQDPQTGEKELWEMKNIQSIGIDNSFDKMSWEASDQGFLMRLSHTVPVLIGRHIQAFVDQLLPPSLNPLTCDWAIHPGGKSIIQAIERAFKLNETHTHASWNTLANYGNMSSATFLFVLDHLSKQVQQAPWSIGLAFGPGLSVEGILLRRVSQ